MGSIGRMDEIGAALRFGVGLTLVWAATVKARDLRGFAAAIHRIAPSVGRRSHTLAVVAVLAEMAFGIASLLGIPQGVWGAAALFGVFAAATAIAVAKGARGNCSCLGSGTNEELSVVTPFRAAGLSIASIAATQLAPADAITRQTPLVAATGIGLFLIAMLLPELRGAVASFRQPPAEPPATRKQSFRYLPPSASLFGLAMEARPTPGQPQKEAGP